MIIPVTDRLRIDTDEHSWRVCELVQRKDGPRFEPISWHASLDQATRSLHDRLLRRSDAEGVAQATAEADRVLSLLSRALSPRFEVRREAE